MTPYFFIKTGLKFLSSKNIRIINFRHQEELITTADGPKFNEDGRHIFTDRTKEQIKTNNENSWILEKVSGMNELLLYLFNACCNPSFLRKYTCFKSCQK